MRAAGGRGGEGRRRGAGWSTIGFLIEGLLFYDWGGGGLLQQQYVAVCSSTYEHGGAKFVHLCGVSRSWCVFSAAIGGRVSVGR